MGYFVYEGRNRQGKFVKGNVKATSSTEARQILVTKQIAVRTLEEKKGLLYAELPSFQREVSFKELVLFIRQFSTLIKAGITILDATSILQEQATSKKMKRVLSLILEDLKMGIPFSDAATKHPKVFPSLFSNMLRAGEVGGQFDEILDRLAIYYEKSHQTRAKVKAAMTYPLVLLVVSIIVIFFLIGFIVPRFASMFTSFGAELPLSTKLLLGMSAFVSSYWWFIGILVIGLITLFLFVRKQESGRLIIDTALLRMPIFGPLLKKAILARMTRTLSTLYEASVPVTQSLTIVGNVVGNKVIENLLLQSSKSVQEGQSISKPLMGHWAIPPFVTQMMNLGEKSGTLDFMLGKVADFYEQEVDQSAEQLKTLLEPLLILFMAVVIGSVVASIMIPIFTILTEVQ
ncbi:type II secretion system F family protein [Paenisporosarcina cavernae]|uniref:Type II secretion system F family protein n=1 Tax=Paenisporosarcina cavernae TaxID=2320858 RepID=A0A385YT82_9BACL|nr:type II secretion system F family protein [Paenisporosarcina cavernae]AYC29754.1 type II secretion system F family protein [Paenisporosarcina cavernae]